MLKFSFCFLMLGLLIFQCKNDSKGSDPALSGIEKEFESKPTEENFSKLVNKYLEIIKDSAKDQDISALLVKAANASKKMNKSDYELLFTNNLVKNYPTHEANKANIIRMISLLHLVGKHTTADVLAYSYIKAYPDDSEVAALKSKLPKESTPESYILEIGQSIFSDTVKGFDDQKAMAYVDACEAFAMVIPNDPQASEFLFKAAETSTTLKTYDKSFSLYDWIISKYPNSSRAPIALFMKGFIFDGTLRDSSNAAKFYNEFIQKYPESPFVKDAKVLLSNLGKTDEQVLEEIKSKGK
ncbi:MAG: tetratricopeptide repeat protein [Saprospiraceae bacterium]